MIKNDEQLEVVRMQLSTAESALDAIRREVLPQNKRMYEVMAESYIDVILELRTQIDAYLGISTVPTGADIVISLEGEDVALGHTSAASVTRFIDTFRRGVQSAVEILESVKRPITARRRERWIENICDLPLVGIAPGSVKILLGEPEFSSLFSDDEKHAFSKAIDLIFDGLSWADVENSESPQSPFALLPKESRQAVLSIITRLLPPRSGDVERVSFKRRTSSTDGEFITATLTRASRNRIRGELGSLASDSEFAELEGVIRSVDLDSQTFVLRERSDDLPDLPCEYGTELEDAVKDYLDNRVIVAGSLETSQKTKLSKMAADTIELASKDDDRKSSSNEPSKAPK